MFWYVIVKGCILLAAWNSVLLWVFLTSMNGYGLTARAIVLLGCKIIQAYFKSAY